MPSLHLHESRRGYSLVELMVGLSILGVLMSSVFASVNLSRRIAETTVYEAAAVTAAQGYLEQVKSMEYNRVLEVCENPTQVPLPTIAPHLNTGGTISMISDPLYLNQMNSRSILIDKDMTGTTAFRLEMPIELTPRIVNLDVGSTPTEALEVSISYRYRTPSTVGGTWRTAQVQIVKAKVPTF